MKRRLISMGLRQPSNTSQAVGRLLMAITVFLFLISSELLAQVDRGNITGKVSDPTGSIIPGAKVTVVNTGNSFASATVTNAEGYYSVPYLSPGTYQLTIEAPGFKRYLRDGIILRTNESPRIDVALEVDNQQ